MEKQNSDKKVRLKVVEALQDDAYKGIARIDPSIMRSLELKRGDVISIKGERETYAIVDRAYPADLGEMIIRVDGIMRRNARAGVGDIVSIDKAEVKEAKKVIIAPSQKGITVQGDPEALKRGLLGRVMVKGDIIVFGGTSRRRDLMSDSPEDMFGGMEDILNQMGFGFPGGMSIGRTQTRFIIVNTTPSAPCVITDSTEVVLSPKAVEVNEEKIPEFTYEDLGGLEEEIKKVREMVELPLKRPEIFERLGIEPPRGVLLYGPPGTGKTLLAKAVANECDASFVTINGPELMSKFYGESEKNLRDKFEEAEKSAPSIIFIDEIDAIAPKREDVQGEVERRVVSQLLTMMDGLQSRGKVIVIGATNRQNSIDPALRRPGRFDREINFSVPDRKGRLQILKIHTRNMPLAKDVSLEEISDVTHGFVGADLASLCKEAAMSVLRRMLPKLKMDESKETPKDVLENLQVIKSDFQDALKNVRPSAMREVLVETPKITWDDVGGLDLAKQELKEVIEWPMTNPASFTNMGIKPPRGVLMYGPPGTGKTLLAKAVAKESGANFILVKGPELLSMWVGKSEEGVRKVFERARQVSPCIIFFDEIDSLAGRRGQETGSKVTEHVLNQLLSEMDGLEELQNVVVVGATNRPDMLDPAILRPGRFDRLLLISPPTSEGRLQVFQIHTKNMPLAKDVKLKEIADKAEGYVGADIEGVCREAALLALRENIDAKEVKKKHFEAAMKKIKPSVTKEAMEKYKRMEQDYLKSARAALETGPNYLG
jgi:transitional endoplasmic reticulum ATPase